MKLEQLLQNINFQTASKGFKNIEVSGIYCDSRKVQQGGLFVACRGYDFNGEIFIKEAIEKGAKVICSEQEYKDASVCCLTCEDTKVFLRQVTRNFYGDISQKTYVVGITGTNGKTSICYLIESILNTDNKKCGVIGTINHRIGNKTFASENTTPGFLDNQKFLASMREEKAKYCLMEVSSHALVQGRVDEIYFQQAIFTNLSDEHLDYHQTKEEYFLAKAQLFTKLSSSSTAIINGDDKYGQCLLNKINGQIMTYGINNSADVMAKNIQCDLDKTVFTLHSYRGEGEIQTSLIGLHNVYNILAAITSAFILNIDLSIIQKGIYNFKGVPGRLERVDYGQDFSIFIDYAHTEDALRNVLTSIKNVSAQKIICVFGCGGDRDKSKRASMGKVVEQLADVVILTSDNPRGENPQDIINDIIQGFEKENYCVIENRKEAIYKALNLAEENDIVLIAGKGHEDYQIIGKKKYPFNEKEIIKQCLHSLN